MSVLDQTADQRYGHGALAEMNDHDDLNRECFVASLFAADPESSVFTEKALGAAMRSIELSIAARADFRSPVTLTSYARMFLRGAAVGAADAKRWTRHVDWLTRALEEA